MKKLKFKKMKRHSLESWIAFLEYSITEFRNIGYKNTDSDNLLLCCLQQLHSKLCSVLDYYQSEFTFQINMPCAIAMKIHTAKFPRDAAYQGDEISLNQIFGIIDQATKI